MARLRPEPAPVAPSRRRRRAARGPRSASGPAADPGSGHCDGPAGDRARLSRAAPSARNFSGPAVDSESRRARDFLSFRSRRPLFGPAAGSRSGRFGVSTRDPTRLDRARHRSKPSPKIFTPGGPRGRGVSPALATRASARVHTGVISITWPPIWPPGLCLFCSMAEAPGRRRFRLASQALRSCALPASGWASGWCRRRPRHPGALGPPRVFCLGPVVSSPSNRRRRSRRSRGGAPPGILACSRVSCLGP